LIYVKLILYQKLFIFLTLFFKIFIIFFFFLKILKVLAYPNMALPLTRNKMIHHCFENVTEKDDNLLRSLKRYNSTGNVVKEKKQVKAS
jgi:hypothetical protein